MWKVYKIFCLCFVYCTNHKIDSDSLFLFCAHFNVLCLFYECSIKHNDISATSCFYFMKCFENHIQNKYNFSNQYFLFCFSKFFFLVFFLALHFCCWSPLVIALSPSLSFFLHFSFVFYQILYQNPKELLSLNRCHFHVEYNFTFISKRWNVPFFVHSAWQSPKRFYWISIPSQTFSKPEHVTTRVNNAQTIQWEILVDTTKR